MAPEMKDIIWKGRSFGTTGVLGKEIMESAESGSYDDSFAELTNERVFSSYYACVSPESVDIIKKLETWEEKSRGTMKKEERVLSLMLIGRFLAKEDFFSINHMKFGALEDFANYLIYLRKEEPGQLENIAKGIIQRKNKLFPSFESWLILLGKNAEVCRWKEGK